MISRILVLFSVCSSLMAVGGNFGGTAEAAQTRMVLFHDQSIHPETGEVKYQILNPSGIVDVTFSATGALLSYTGQDGRAVQVKIHADYPVLPQATDNPNVNRRNQMMSKIFEKSGRALIGATLNGYSTDLAGLNLTLLVKLDRSRKIGFFATDYGLADVILITPQESATLADTIVRMISAEVSKQIKESESQLSAEAEKKPIGDISTRVSSPARGRKTIRSCDVLFAPAR